MKLLIALSICLSVLSSFAQESILRPSIQPEQKLGANDLLKVSVHNAPELSGDVRVGQDGTLRFPMLKLPLNARDKAPAEVEKLLTDALKDEDLFANPLVRVTVIEYQGRTVTVSGAVRKATSFQAMGGITLFDALARAEGLSPEAGAELTVTRQATGPGNNPSSREALRVSIKDLFSGADPSLNLILTGGEQIRVLEASRIYVVGNVKKQGAISLGASPNTTVLKAIAQAEGLAPYANNTAYIYRSESKGGAKQEITLNLKNVLKGREQSLELQPEDILYIPDNKGQRLTAQALDRILAFGTSTVSGVLVFGQVR